MQQKIIDDCDLSTHRGWAFGIGLEVKKKTIF